MSTRNFQPGDAYGCGFTTKSATGALADADATPTAAISRNGTVDGAVAVTVTRNSTGDYSAACTLPGGYSPGDRVSLKVLATIGGVATGEYIDHVRLVGWPNAVGSAGSLLTSGTGAGQLNPSGGAVPVTPSGLDSIVVEAAAGGNPQINARQALAYAVAGPVGVLSGAAGTTISVYNPGGTAQRASVTVDSNGNRSAVTLTPPA